MAVREKWDNQPMEVNRVAGDLGPKRARKKILQIRERDGNKCWLCGQRVSQDAPVNGRMAASVDHVMPLADGGTNDLDNLRLAHRKCNWKRGRKPVTEAA